MKITNTNKVQMKSINEILVGDTFMAERKDKRDGVGVYMKVDGNNGVILGTYSSPKRCFAVNLATGQMRPFDTFAMVEPIEAEVVF